MEILKIQKKNRERKRREVKKSVRKQLKQNMLVRSMWSNQHSSSCYNTLMGNCYFEANQVSPVKIYGTVYQIVHEQNLTDAHLLWKREYPAYTNKLSTETALDIFIDLAYKVSGLSVLIF